MARAGFRYLDRVPPMTKEDMVKAFRSLLRKYDELHGSKWRWGEYYVEFSATCGVDVPNPEGAGPKDLRLPIRCGFSRAMREVLPEKEYQFQRAFELAEEFVDAILRFHGLHAECGTRSDGPACVPVQTDTQHLDSSVARDTRSALNLAMPMGTRVLGAIRSMGVENMWEDGKEPNLVDALNRTLGGIKRPYPPGTYVGAKGKPGSCDVVVDSCWIEAKCSWTYTTDQSESRANPSFQKHLLTDATESALKDVTVKLPSLIGQPDARSIGFVLVCFDSDSLPLDISLVEELERRGELRAGVWVKQELAPWRNPRNPRCRIRAFYWERPATQAV